MINIPVLRKNVGLTQRQFAQALRIPVRTLQEWEQGRRIPSGAAHALFDIAKRHPQIIKESFEEQQNKQHQASRALDQMVDYLLDRNDIAFTDLVLDWHRDDLECAYTPPPKDTDNIRLAIKASIIERLVEVLSAPPHSEYQLIPAWCKSIPALEAPMKLQSDQLLDQERYCAAFAKRNLLVAENFMFFV